MKSLVKLLLIVIVFFIAGLVALNVYNKKSGDVFMILGYTTFINTGSSMEPEIESGDLIVVKRYNKYDIDDIISFETKKGTNTHRIIEINKKGYKTKGDSNNFVDSEIVKQHKIYGKVIYNAGNYGKLVNFIKKYEKVLYVVFPIIILIALIYIIRI